MSLPQTVQDTIAAMAQGMAEVVADNPVTSNVAFMKLTKAGVWVFGANEDEVEEGSRWAIHPEAFMAGYQAWGDDSDLLGEEMALIQGRNIVKADLPSVGGDWKRQLSCQMLCISGMDEGVCALYGTTSKGGTDELTKFINTTIRRAKTGVTQRVPVVELESSHYKHKKYGRINTPILRIVDWVDMEVIAALVAASEPAEPVVAPVVEPEPEPATSKRRRRART